MVLQPVISDVREAVRAVIAVEALRHGETLVTANRR
jgi:hypothetical protein